MKFTLAIKTLERLDSFKRLIDGIHKHTKSEVDLFVVCTAGDDPSINYCQENGIEFIVSYKRCHTVSDNLLLYAYYHHTPNNTLVSVEDDIIILGDAWEKDWILGAGKWGMMCHSFQSEVDGRKPTWENPFFSESTCGFQIFATTRQALSRIGLQSLAYFGSHSDTDLMRRHCIRMVKTKGWPQTNDVHFPSLCTSKAGADWSLETTTGCDAPGKISHNYQVYGFRWHDWTQHPHGVVQWEPWQSHGEREFFLTAIDDWLDRKEQCK